MPNIGRLNLIDFSVLILFLIAFYNSIRGGLLIEILKTISIVLIGFFSFHYYIFFSGRLKKLIFLNKNLESLSFILIFVSLWFVSFIFRKIIVLIFNKKEKISTLERLIAGLFCIFRFSFVLSLIIFIISSFSFNTDCKKSFSYNFKNFTPFLYINFVKLINKFNYNLKINEKVVKYYETKRDISKNN